MKLTLCNEVLREMSLAEQARYAAALGYQGLEIAPFTLDAQAPHELDERAIATVRRTVEAEGLRVSGLHWLLLAPEGLSITDAQPAVIERTRAVIAAQIEVCAQLGGEYLIHGSPKQRELPNVGRDRARDRAIETLAFAAERAQAAGVDYLLEPLSHDQTAFVNTLDEAVAIVERIGSPAFATMIDCCSAARAEAAPIEELLMRHRPGDRVRHVHVNDPNLRAPGQGELRFGPIVQTLMDAGYDRWIGVEPFDYVPDGRGAAAFAIGTVRACIDAGTAASAP